MSQKIANTTIAADIGTFTVKIGDTKSTVTKLQSNENTFTTSTNCVQSTEKLLDIYYREYLTNDANKLITEVPPFTSMQTKRALCERMLDFQRITHYYCDLTCIFSLFASGHTSGLVIDFGHLSTYVVPIYEGFPIYHAIEKYNVGGASIKNSLQNILNTKITSESFEYLCKEKCKVKLNGEIMNEKNNECILPDGKNIAITNELTYCPDMIFRQETDKGRDGVVNRIKQCVAKCDSETSAMLLKSIVISGGLSLVDGIKSRIMDEMQPQHVEVEEMKNRDILGWIGAARVSSLSCFENKWITKKDISEGNYFYFN